MLIVISFAGASTAAADAAMEHPAPKCRASDGLVRRSVTAGGLRRSYLVAAPPGLTSSAPVLLAFHGYSSSAAALAARSRLHEAASTRGYVTVFPEGAGSPSRWGLPGRLAGPDDTAFVDALLHDLRRHRCGDLRAVYAAGFSNGAAFIGHLACRRPNQLRGMAFVGGAGLVGACAPDRTPPVPVAIVHGSDDRAVPATGGPVLGGALRAEPLTTSVARWRRRAGRRVGVVVVTGRGHTWPGVANEAILGTFAG